MSSLKAQADASTSISPPALFGLLSIILVCCHRAVLNDGDTYTHIAAGLWMLDHGAVLRTDPFSATFAGRAWIAHEWLSELLFALAYRLDGLTGVVLLTAAAAGLAIANLARHVGQSSNWAATMVLTAGAFVCLTPSLLARPHLLALPLLEIWVAALLAARREDRAPAWGLLPVMTVWANLHGGFAFGLVMAAAFALEATMQAGWRAGWADRGVRRWWGFLAAATGATLLTPYGVDGLLFPFRLVQFESLAVIDEWQPIDLSTNLGFDGVMLALVAVLWVGRIRLPVIRAVVLASLVYLAFAHARHAPLFGVVGALILAEPIGRAFRGARPETRRLVGQRVGWSGVAVAVGLRLAHPVPLADSIASPISALAQLPESVKATPVLNSDRFGGYLALTGLRQFIDGRVELFGDAFVADYVAMSNADGVKLRESLARYGVGWALLTPGDPLVARFAGLAGWQRQYADGVAVVFVRG